MRIYLAGYITGGENLSKCIEWRRKIRNHYDNWKGTNERYPICWLDPLNSGEGDEISSDGLKSKVPPHAIVHKDYKSVAIADLIVANMETFGCDRPLIGTISELAWAWDRHIPIVMVTKEKQYIDHPFTSYFASWYVKSVDELLEKKVINEFYKAWHTAQY